MPSRLSTPANDGMDMDADPLVYSGPNRSICMAVLGQEHDSYTIFDTPVDRKVLPGPLACQVNVQLNHDVLGRIYESFRNDRSGSINFLGMTVACFFTLTYVFWPCRTVLLPSIRCSNSVTLATGRILPTGCKPLSCCHVYLKYSYH